MIPPFGGSQLEAQASNTPLAFRWWLQQSPDSATPPFISPILESLGGALLVHDALPSGSRFSPQKSWTMPALPRHPLQPKPHTVLSKVHRHPFFMFGLPFLATIVGASFALTTFTQTRYDLRDQQVTSMAQEEQMKMAKDRRRVDLREEYYRLSAGGEEANNEDQWENKWVRRCDCIRFSCSSGSEACCHSLFRHHPKTSAQIARSSGMGTAPS